MPKDEINEEVVEQPKVENTKYVEGLYKSIKPIRVVKKLSHMDKKNSDGTIARTFGTWASKADNFIFFSNNKSVKLAKEDLKLKQIQQLIDNGTIFRVLQ